MTEIEELREGLMESFRGLRAGTLEAKDVVELNNTAGKVISTYKVQLANCALSGEKPNFPGLGSSAPPLIAIDSSPQLR